MSEASRLHAFLGELRRWPHLYSLLRVLWRLGKDVPIETLRELAPAASRFGGPKGTFSALAALDEGHLSGRVLARGQQIPPAPEGGLLPRLRQDEFQPWPIFWTHHRGAHL
jgi:hypothetical protein